MENEKNKTSNTMVIDEAVAQKRDKEQQKQMKKSVVLVIVGSLIYSFGVVWILQLGGFFSGGVTGTSQLIVGLIEKFGGSSAIRGYLGMFVGLINVPLCLIGWRGVSKRFVILTVMSITIQTIVMSLLSNLTISPFVHILSDGSASNGVVDFFMNGNFSLIRDRNSAYVEDVFVLSMSAGTRLLLAITGGLITGFGAALCLKGGGSTGGMDIISNYLVMKKRISFVKYQFTVDVIIIVASSLISVENVLYTIVRLIVYMKVIEAVYKIYETIRIEVITNSADDIKKKLFENFSHSLTIYDAVGGYTGQGKKVIEAYISNFELNEYLEIIKNEDPNAFVVISQVKTIRGNYVQRTVV